MVELPELPQTDPSDEVAPDAIQLMTVATFNGLCRLITALAENGFLTADQLREMHEGITYPLDDEDWRDDSFVGGTRETVERVLASALRAAIE